MDLPNDERGTQASYIPAQCYVKTQSQNPANVADAVHNSCFACHHDSQRPNTVNDADLQLEYSFADAARTNPWTNLFEDRRQRVAEIDDEEILAWVRYDNYATGPAVTPLQSAGERSAMGLEVRLTDHFPPRWDANDNGRWDGYVPDAGFVFDESGWDHAPDGKLTGWRAFAFRPFPGAFWPTNGSMGDALIRLPPAFRQTRDGVDSLEIYALNLTILEAIIHRESRPIKATDEVALGVDLDKDGKLATATQVTYRWAPLQGETMSWVGRARVEQAAGRVRLAAGLFPKGTEFLHSVRYMDVVDGEVHMAARMKELRYTQKRSWLSYSDIEQSLAAEAKEKDDFPDRLRTAWGEFERGVPNGQGWVFQGFIEDAYGELRPQTLGETRACVGCHGGVGATQDSIFSFGRKLEPSSFRGGWFHPTQHGLQGVPDAATRDAGTAAGEYAAWLVATGAGDDYRSNQELANKAFDRGGRLRFDFAAALAVDITTAILPSPGRALELNKAYRTLVADQDFVWGRDANVAALDASVWRELPLEQSTGVEVAKKGESWRGLKLARASRK